MHYVVLPTSPPSESSLVAWGHLRHQENPTWLVLLYVPWLQVQLPASWQLALQVRYLLAFICFQGLYRVWNSWKSLETCPAFFPIWKKSKKRLKVWSFFFKAAAITLQVILSFGQILFNLDCTFAAIMKKALFLLFLKVFLNPLSPNSAQNQFSPNDIHRLSWAKSMRINKMITKRNVFDLLPNSLNKFFKKMYRDQFGEFACGYWDLKG